MLNDNFRKGIVLKRIENRKFEIKDLYDESIKTSKLFGKSMLAYSEIQIGTTVYIIQDFPENNQRDWRILTDTLFKGDEYLWNLRIELDTFLSNQKK